MKKLSIILCFLCITPVLFSQLIDKQNYIQLNNPRGDTIFIVKDQIESISIEDGEDIYIFTSRTISDRFYLGRQLRFRASHNGFNDVYSFRAQLVNMISKTYTTKYHYTSGLVDTVSYYVGDSLAFKTAYSYSGSVVSEKSAPINE